MNLLEKVWPLINLPEREIRRLLCLAPAVFKELEVVLVKAKELLLALIKPVSDQVPELPPALISPDEFSLIRLRPECRLLLFGLRRQWHFRVGLGQGL